jgi:hypothetical protein
LQCEWAYQNGYSVNINLADDVKYTNANQAIKN